MKNLVISLLALGSISAFAGESCKITDAQKVEAFFTAAYLGVSAEIAIETLTKSKLFQAKINQGKYVKAVKINYQDIGTGKFELELSSFHGSKSEEVVAGYVRHRPIPSSELQAIFSFCD